MIDVKSNKFKKLGDKAKILLLTSAVTGKQIAFSNLFCDVIQINHPDDEMYFNQIVNEIQSAKIDYKIEKIVFKKPKLTEIINILSLMQNQLKKSFTLEELKIIGEYFYNFYEKKDWKSNGIKMTDWKKQLIYAANNWDFKSRFKTVKHTDILEELSKAFNVSI